MQLGAGHGSSTLSSPTIPAGFETRRAVGDDRIHRAWQHGPAYLAIISCQLNAEAIALSQRFGLTLATTLDVIHGTTATNGQLKIAWPAKVLSGNLEPGFTIDLAHKDLTLIVDAANAVKVPVPIAAVAREAFNVARSRGHGALDFSAMVDVLCDYASIEKPRLQ